MRFLLALLALAIAAPALAQIAPPPPVARGGDVVVVAPGAQKMSAWKRADTDHAVLFSQGSEAELRRVAQNIERLHALMTRLYRPAGSADEALKPTIILVDGTDQLRETGLTELRAQEGPFSPDFAGRRYYDPGENGPLLVVARSDQVINLNTNRRYNYDCDMLVADGGTGMCGTMVPDHHPVIRAWESVLYGAYAQHFKLTYLPAAYPRWYLDGIGAVFSTLRVAKDGTLEYALPPILHNQMFLSYGFPDVGAVVSGRYLDAPWKETRWSPYGAWLLTHYLVFSKLSAERSRQFALYMAALRRGEPMAQAAAAFGDLRKLEREVASYGVHRIPYAHTARAIPAAPDPLLTRLSAASGAVIDARLGAGPVQTSDNPEALLIAAERDCREGRHAVCLQATERVLAAAPDTAAALAWKGIALTDRALTGPADARRAALAEARRIIDRAAALDERLPLPLLARFRSYARAGEPVPDVAMRGMATVIRLVPAAPAPRLELAQELVRQGHADLARRVLHPVIDGSYDSPERRAALSLFAAIAQPTGAD